MKLYIHLPNSLIAACVCRKLNLSNSVLRIKKFAKCNLQVEDNGMRAFLKFSCHKCLTTL